MGKEGIGNVGDNQSPTQGSKFGAMAASKGVVVVVEEEQGGSIAPPTDSISWS